MTNAIYPKWKEAIMQASANSSLAGTGTTGVWCSLLDTGVYTYNPVHDFYNDVTGVVGTDVEVAAPKTYTNGSFDGADVTFVSVSGATIEAILLYVKNAGANSTWYLVVYLDAGIPTLPVTPNGGNISITWDSTGIFTI